MQSFLLFITHHLTLFYLLAGVLLLIGLLEAMRTKRNQQGVEVTQAIHLMNHQHAMVLDIRDKAAFQKGHIVHALSMPNATQANIAKHLERHKNKPIILVCETGRNAHMLAAQDQSNQNIYYLLGGMRAWIEAQMPLVSQQKD